MQSTITIQVIWKYFYSLKSPREHGTLYQLRNRLNRTNVVVDPTHDFNACDDFFQQIVQSHIIAATLEFLGMDNMDETPDEEVLSKAQEVWMLPANERRDVLDKLCKGVVDCL